MSGKPAKMNVYDSFSAWKEDQTEANQQIINELQKLIDKTAPQFITTVKWGQGCWTDSDIPRIYIHTEDDHVQLGFYNGSTLNDPQGILSGTGKHVRFVKVYSNDDVNPGAFTDLIKQVT